MYFYGGIAKLNPDWLLAALPMKIWLYQHGVFFLISKLLQETWTAFAMSWAGAVFDLTIVWLLLWHRSRPFAFIVLVVFHLMTWQLFPMLGMFPWLMMGSMLIYFSPDWPRQLAKRLKYPWKPSTDPKSVDIPACSGTSTDALQVPNVWLARFAAMAIAIFAIAQIVIPLRHWAYTGNVRWNEEGYRFSWRMMLSEKIGYVTYRVKENSTQKVWHVEPAEYLTPLQLERMSINPDMIHQLALIIANNFQSRGHLDINVYAEAFLAFNGRENERIIDPSVDLANLDRTLLAKSWILPFRSG